MFCVPSTNKKPTTGIVIWVQVDDGSWLKFWLQHKLIMALIIFIYFIIFTFSCDSTSSHELSLTEISLVVFFFCTNNMVYIHTILFLPFFIYVVAINITGVLSFLNLQCFIYFQALALINFFYFYIIIIMWNAVITFHFSLYFKVCTIKVAASAEGLVIALM